ITSSEQAEMHCELLLPLLARRHATLPETAQAGLLNILASLLSRVPQLATSISTYTIASQLFETLPSRPSRRALVAVFCMISEHRRGSQTAARLLDDLNSFSTKRIDEPDFDRRLTAFAELNEQIWGSLTPIEWEPLLYHALWQIRDEEELSLRSSA